VTRTWLALVPAVEGTSDDPLAAVPVPASARAALHAADGRCVGVLAAWHRPGKPVRDAVLVDGAVIDPDGDPGWVSLLLLPVGRAPLFDDPAVSGALRAMLAGPPADVVSTLVRDSTHLAGAVTVRRADPRALADDPFARLGLPILARVDGGLFGRRAAPAGPVIQRYAGQPWPAAGFGP